MKISQISSHNYRLNNNFAPRAKYTNTFNTAFKNMQIQDTVQFTGKTEGAKARYESIVRENSNDSDYKEATVYTQDINFLLDLDDEDFKKIIMKPVEYEDTAGRPSKSTIFFYTDALATEKLLNKLNDKKAAFEILKTQKDWCGTTALHTAAYANDPVKAESILTAVNSDDKKALMKIEEIDDDAYSIAIMQQDRATLDVFKQYHNQIYRINYK